MTWHGMAWHGMAPEEPERREGRWASRWPPGLTTASVVGVGAIGVGRGDVGSSSSAVCSDDAMVAPCGTRGTALLALCHPKEIS